MYCTKEIKVSFFESELTDVNNIARLLNLIRPLVAGGATVIDQAAKGTLQGRCWGKSYITRRQERVT